MVDKVLKEQIHNINEKLSDLKSLVKDIRTIRDSQIRHTNVLADNTETLKNHNGRLTKVEEWKHQFEGGKKVLAGLWTVVGAIIISAVFAIFNMYLTVDKLPETIELQVLGIIEDKIINNEIQIIYDDSLNNK